MLTNDEIAHQALNATRFTTYWLDSLPTASINPVLEQNTYCDLLVVGGGFCGLWGAIQAKEKNPQKDVVLIEAFSIANGASGRPAAIMSTSVMHGIDNTERMFPQEVEELERLGRENMDGFRAAVENYNLDCDVEWNGELTVSIGDQGLEAINEGFELYLKYGHDAQKLDKNAVQSEIHSPIFHAGVWSKKRSGTIHPGKLARELKRVASELGVRIFEYTPHVSNKIHRDKRQGDKVLVSTPHADIIANKVMLATNAWAVGHRKIRNRVSAIRDRIVVTEPLTDEQMESIGWNNRQGIYDTRTQLNYLRLTKDNRILFGGRLGYFYGDNTDPLYDKSPAPYIRLVNAFYRTFPQLKGKIVFSHA